MSDLPGVRQGLSSFLAQSPQCWCCGRTFGKGDVRQDSDNKKWLECQLGPDVLNAGICEDCATRWYACFRCGRVPGHKPAYNPYLWTRALEQEDKDLLRTAGLDELTVYCELCVVRGFLLKDDCVESAPSKKMAFGLAKLIARHWGASFYIEEKGLPIAENEVSRVDQLAAMYCHVLINRPEMLEIVIAEANKNPSSRSALRMYEGVFEGQEHLMDPQLMGWIQDKNAHRPSKHRFNRPVPQHVTFLTVLILLHIGNCPLISGSKLTPTRSRGTTDEKGCSICDAVAQVLTDIGHKLSYLAVEQIWSRNIRKVG